MIDLEKMAKEHEKLFPNATAESQVWKLEEEIGEYQKSETYEDSIKELADVWIVCGGLYRWMPRLSKAVFCFFSDDVIDDVYTLSEIEKEVNRKWQVNLKRKWVWNGKTYHHVGDDVNE